MPTPGEKRALSLLREGTLMRVHGGYWLRPFDVLRFCDSGHRLTEEGYRSDRWTSTRTLRKIAARFTGNQARHPDIKPRTD